MNDIKDDLSRTLIWRALYDMVRDGKLSSEEYIDIFTELISSEKSDDLVVNQIKFINASLSTLTPKKYRVELATRLFNWAMSQLKRLPKTEKARILAIKQELSTYAKTEENISLLIRWLKGTNDDLKDLETGNKISWDIITKAYQSQNLTKEEKRKLFDEMA